METVGIDEEYRISFYELAPMNRNLVYRPVHKDDDLARCEERDSPEERDELRVASMRGASMGRASS